MPFFYIQTQKFCSNGGDGGVYVDGYSKTGENTRYMSTHTENYFFKNDYIIELPDESPFLLNYCIANIINAERWIINDSSWEHCFVWRVEENQKITTSTPFSIINCRYKEGENPETYYLWDANTPVYAVKNPNSDFPYRPTLGYDYKMRYLIPKSRAVTENDLQKNDPFLLFQTHQTRRFGEGIRRAFRFCLTRHDYFRAADGSLMLRKSGPLLSRNWWMYREAMDKVYQFIAPLQIDKEGVFRVAPPLRKAIMPLCVTDAKGARKRNRTTTTEKISVENKAQILLSDWMVKLHDSSRGIKEWHHDLNFDLLHPRFFNQLIIKLAHAEQFIYYTDPSVFAGLDAPFQGLPPQYSFNDYPTRWKGDVAQLRTLYTALHDALRWLARNMPPAYYRFDPNYERGFFQGFWWLNDADQLVKRFNYRETNEQAHEIPAREWFESTFYLWFDAAFASISLYALFLAQVEIKPATETDKVQPFTEPWAGALRDSKILQRKTFLNRSKVLRWTGSREGFDPFNIATKNERLALDTMPRILPPDSMRDFYFWGAVIYERRGLVSYVPPAAPPEPEFSATLNLPPVKTPFPWDNTIHPSDEEVAERWRFMELSPRQREDDKARRDCLENVWRWEADTRGPDETFEEWRGRNQVEWRRARALCQFSGQSFGGGDFGGAGSGGSY